VFTISHDTMISSFGKINTFQYEQTFSDSNTSDNYQQKSLLKQFKTKKPMKVSGHAKIIRWNDVGSLIAVGFDEGEVGVIEPESTLFYPQKIDFISSDGDKASMISLNWVYLKEQNDVDASNLCSLFLHSGINVKERVGMLPLPTSLSASNYQQDNTISHSSLLVTLSANQILRGYVSGLQPLFAINLFSVIKEMAGLQISPNSLICSLSSSISVLFQSSSVGTSSSSIDSKKINFSFLSWPRLESCGRISVIVEEMSYNLLKFCDDVKTFSRKWKDCTKVVQAKMQLLQSALEGYQLDMSPIEFMFSMASCGLWHPVATSAFPNHWNEQGINRLRSSIDSTLLGIIKFLSLSATPQIENICLSCRFV
jgi:hypothetical protein